MPQRIGLPQDQWPSADRMIWIRATVAINFFDESARAAHWRPKSQAQAAYAYGRWLAFLAAHCPHSLSEPAAERANQDRLRAFVDALVARVVPMSAAAEINHLLLALSVIAPTGDWSWLRQWQYRWQKLARPREKRSKMIHPARLVDLGLRLMDQAERAVPSIDAARTYRDGLLIALLATRPLRRRSLASLKVGKNLTLEGTRFVLSIDEMDTKSGQAIEFPLPPAFTAYVQRYLEHHRRLFPGADRHDGLWASSKGTALCAEAIYDIFCRRTKEHFGFAIYPHLLRDIAATAIAREAPGSMLIARDLLTHASITTTSRYYVAANTLEAARQHGTTIEHLRSPKS